MNAEFLSVRRRLLGVVLVATVTLGACGGSSGSGAGTTSSESSISDVADHNDSDVMFAQMMIPHHEQAIEMSDIALDPAVGAGTSIVDLARAIKDAQDPEITQMRAFLTQRGKSETADPMMDHGSMMEGMLSLDELTALGSLRGASFDSAWASAMIRHHEGAVKMAQEVIADGSNSEMIGLARQIISTQTAEIEVLRRLT